MGSLQAEGPEPVAIIGIACHLPGGITSEDELWSLLQDARSAQTDVPPSRFNLDAFYNPQNDLPDTIPMRGGYFLDEDLRLFENSFFGINNLEAINMDPQQRKLLEVCFECLESAGVGLEKVAGARVGCYVANFTTDFQNINTKDPGYLHRLTALGQGATLLSNRISYIMDLKGPSLTLDTACSSSLYCLHLAVQALRQRECDSAFVAGANLIQSPEQHMGTARLGVLSRTSTCHSFAADADGYGRADGVGALYVKRLSDAIRDGDPIRSVIRGTAINSNGKGNGITMPSVTGQRDVIERAYADAGIDRFSTDYVECHGTGTQVGDPIEVAAVSEFFRHPERLQSSDNPIYIGSVKSNLGHSEAASGITSIIKATLALEKRWIPATIGVNELNPDIPWHENATQVVRKGMPWPKSSRRDACQRVSINSFGYGGSNAHCILEAYSPSDPVDSARPEQEPEDPLMLFPVSAATEYSLAKRVESLAKLNVELLSLTDLAHTLIKRRSNLQYRGYMIGRRHTWSSDIQLEEVKATTTKHHKSNNAPLAFIFTGQGAQWATMGKSLYDRFPTFRQRIRYLDKILAALPEPPRQSLRNILLDSEHSSAIHLPEFSQPACTAVQIALIDLLHEWGVSPKYVIGHSSGEIAAAYAAGFISAAAAIIVAHGRGLIVSTLTLPGAMLAVGMSEEEADTEIEDCRLLAHVRVACVNSPENVTISGDEDAIDQLSSRLSSLGRFARKVKTGGRAYHSHHMKTVGKAYENFMRSSVPEPWTLASRGQNAVMISSVNARVVQQAEAASPSYWRRNLESPVLFKQAIEVLSSMDSCQFIELGPHPALELVVKQTTAQAKPTEKQPLYMSTIVRNKDGAQSLLNLAGRLWSNGHAIDLDRVNGIALDSAGMLEDGRRPRVISNLPTYKWCYGDPLWNESRLSKEYRFRRFGHDELLGTMVPGMSGSTHIWRNKLNLHDVPWLEDHRLGDEIVYPGAAYIDMALKAVQQVQQVKSEESCIEIRDLRIQRALALTRGQSIELFTELKRTAISNVWHSSTTWDFAISTFEDGQSVRRAVGQIAVIPNSEEPRREEPIVKFNEEVHGVRNWYRRFQIAGLGFGPSFRVLKAIYGPRMRNDLVARVELKGETVKPDPYQGRYAYRIHPTIIDSQFQAALIATTKGKIDDLRAQVPTAIDRVRFLPGFEHSRISSYQGHVQAKPAAAGLMTCNAQLQNESGRTVLSIHNLNATLYSGPMATDAERHPMMRVDWIPDLHQLPLGHCDGLTRAIEEASDEQDIEGLTENAYLLGFAAKMRCDSSILIATESLDAVSTWKMLGGGSKHTYLNSVTCSRITGGGSLEGYHFNGLAASSEHGAYRRLDDEKFDIIVTDGNMKDQLCGMLDSNLKHGGLIIYTGYLPTGVRRDPNTVVTTTGKHQDISVLRRHSVPRPMVNGHGLGEPSDKILLISGDEDGTFDDHFNNQFVERTRAALVRSRFSGLDEAEVPSGCTAIITAELHKSFLTTASPAQLQTVQMIANRAARIIWVAGGSLLNPQCPEAAAALGLSRAIMLEQPAIHFQVVCLETPVLDLRSAAECINSILQQPPTKGSDREFIQHHGILHVSRFIPSRALNTQFFHRQVSSTQLLPLKSSPSLQLEISSPGQFSTLHFTPRPSSSQSSSSSHVTVEIKSIGLNAKDAYSLSGKIPTHERTFALESTGVITSVGSTADPNLQVGDAVIVAAPTQFSTTLTVPDWACVRMLPEESFTDLSVVPIAHMTALHALVDRANLRSGERVLIHSATGGVGLAAIKLAKSLGAEIYATAGTEEKRTFLIHECGVAAERVFDSRSTGFVEGIRRVTAGEGVDVVLNSLAGERLHASLECCGMFGRFVEIGKRDILDKGKLDLGIFEKGLTFTAFDLSEYYYSKTQKGRNVWTKLLRDGVKLYRKFTAGSPLGSKPPLVFDAGKTQDAFRAFANSTRMGKICVSFEDREVLVPVKPMRYAYSFSPSKTYLLVGCLGGLGRSLTRYMLENGARHFVFIGRTGTDKAAAKSLVDDVQLHGASVKVVRGDVQDYETVREAVDGMTLPLGGVVQAAMGLGESLFHNMSHQKWHSSLGPKVKGSWNIHRAIEGKDENLDFFLMTSSVAGSVGTATESNYCTANSFLDYFAKYRRRLGKPATAIGFGTISEIGYLHEHPDIERMLERRGLSATTEAEFLDICDIALCSSRNSAQNITTDPARGWIKSAHILTGLETVSKRTDWERGYEGAAQDEMADPRLSILLHAEKNRIVGQSGGQSSSEKDRDASALPSAVEAAVKAKDSDEIVGKVFDCLAAKMSQLVLMPVDSIGTDMNLSSVGMDSMLAAEYRSFIFHTLKTDVPFLTLMDTAATMNDVAVLISDRLLAA